MRNEINLVYTKFESLDGTTTYGYRLWSDHAAVYNNCFDSFDQVDQFVAGIGAERLVSGLTAHTMFEQDKPIEALVINGETAILFTAGLPTTEGNPNEKD